jgi:PTS system nitrogen regulatory IIA component
VDFEIRKNRETKMKLIDVLRKECVVAGTQFDCKEDVLHEIAQVAKKCSIIEKVDAQDILAGLQERESLGSTGFGQGIAIPHCRLQSVTDFLVGIMTIPSGVDFEALDGEPVRLVIFIIAPEVAGNKHVKLLSAISQTLLVPGATEEILSETTAEAVYESFLRHTRADIDTSKQTAKCQFNVFVQDENVFLDILEKLSGIETSSLVVVSVENVGAYLAKVPLFADFWSDKSSSFSKLIISVVDKGLSNETIRRIETVTGDLGKSTGVMVTAQDLSYASGFF